MNNYDQEFWGSHFLRQTHVSSCGSQKDSKPRPKIARLCLSAENVPQKSLAKLTP